MLFIEMRKRRVIKKAYERLHRDFPRSTFLVYWEPHADGFFVRTNDKELFDSEIYTHYIAQMRIRVFRKAGFSVWFGWDSINEESGNVYNAKESKSKEAHEAKEAVFAQS